MTQGLIASDPWQIWAARKQLLAWYQKRLRAVFRRSAERVHAPEIFRSPTGLMTLCFAIRDHGPDANYVVAGIGLKNRDDYVQPGDQQVELTRRDQPSHANADRQILAALASDFRIATTEPELDALLPNAS